jgi:hypothetical protein
VGFAAGAADTAGAGCADAVADAAAGAAAVAAGVGFGGSTGLAFAAGAASTGAAAAGFASAVVATGVGTAAAGAIVVGTADATAAGAGWCAAVGSAAFHSPCLLSFPPLPFGVAPLISVVDVDGEYGDSDGKPPEGRRTGGPAMEGEDAAEVPTTEGEAGVCSWGRPLLGRAGTEGPALLTGEAEGAAFEDAAESWGASATSTAAGFDAATTGAGAEAGGTTGAAVAATDAGGVASAGFFSAATGFDAGATDAGF